VSGLPAPRTPPTRLPLRRHRALRTTRSALVRATDAYVSGWTASGAAGRSRPAGRGPANCALQVLIAAILVTAIRADRISMAGAGREWTKLETADNSSAEAAEYEPEARQFGRPTRPAATDAVQPHHAYRIRHVTPQVGARTPARFVPLRVSSRWRRPQISDGSPAAYA